MFYKNFLYPTGLILIIIGAGVIFTQYKYIAQLQRKYQLTSEHVIKLNKQISWMEKQAEMVTDTMLKHKEKLLQEKGKTDAIRKKLQQIQTNDYCARMPVPDDIIRLQHEASRYEELPVNTYPSQPADPHPNSST